MIAPRAFSSVSLASLLIAATSCWSATLPELAESGDTPAAMALLEAGSHPNEASGDGTTALHWAAHHGDLALTSALIEAGAETNLSNDYGVTPLAAAAVEANAELIKLLLDAGADVEAANPEGQTALMVVARTGALESARSLLENGANVNATESFGGQSALMWAAAQRQANMVSLLLENGADANARGTFRNWPRRVTAEPRIKIMQTGGFTPLLYAAREGCIECISRLVDGGADINLSDPDGMTPLVLALLNRNFDTAGRLIELGADVNRWDWWGRTPLYIAIDLDPIPESRHGDLPALDALTGLDIARMLLDRGANVNARLRQQPPLRAEPGDRGYTDGSPDVLVLTTGASALHTAVKSANDEAVRLLLEHGADVSFPNVFGITPALTAAGLGHWYGIFSDYATRGRYREAADGINTLRLLLDAGADIDARSAELNFGFQRPQLSGLTAAHGAAFLGWHDMLEFLHDELDLDIGAPSTGGVTPQALALSEERTETAAFIDQLLAE